MWLVNTPGDSNVNVCYSYNVAHTIAIYYNYNPDLEQAFMLVHIKSVSAFWLLILYII